MKFWVFTEILILAVKSYVKDAVKPVYFIFIKQIKSQSLIKSIHLYAGNLLYVVINQDEIQIKVVC